MHPSRYEPSRLVSRRFVSSRYWYARRMPAPRGPDPARRSERAHTAILEATRDLIVEVGYDSMSIEGIAARAGVGKQTIYRWWPSKAAVLLDAFLDLCLLYTSPSPRDS